jgi:hypothetical protein
MVPCNNIQFAAYGWSQPRGFYPHDLPQDWRLSFYSNVFQAVVVPAAVWLAEAPVDIAAWLDEVDEDFRFYLEIVDIQQESAKLTEIALLFGAQLAGIIVRPPQSGVVDVESCRALLKINAFAPVCLWLATGMELSDVHKSLLHDGGVSFCIDTDGISTEQLSALAAAANFVLVALAPQADYTARQWRETLERYMYCGAGNRHIVLMYESPEANLEVLRAGVMVRDILLGAQHKQNEMN